jgi:membrane associated rhomboid family serine protease
MIFVPVWDQNYLKSVRFQYVTIALILLNILIFFAVNLASFRDFSEVVAEFALVPNDFLPWTKFFPLRPEHATFITYMFLHGGFFHLMANMIFMFVFADNVEDAMGHVRFIVFFVLCGIAAAFAHIALTSQTASPLIGASGAVSGVLGAYLLLHPHALVWVILPLPKIIFVPLRFPAWIVIFAWIAAQISSGFLFPAASTAWWSHLGGFLAGIFLILIMRRPSAHLFSDETGT